MRPEFSEVLHGMLVERLGELGRVFDESWSYDMSKAGDRALGVWGRSEFSMSFEDQRFCFTVDFDDDMVRLHHSWRSRDLSKVVGYRKSVLCYGDPEFVDKLLGCAVGFFEGMIGDGVSEG